MAEHASSRAVWFVTLTYGGGYDDPAAYVLNRKHVEGWAKALRNDGHSFRYVSTGEFGSEKGRAHWHVALFWQSEPPTVPMGQRFQWTLTNRKTGEAKPCWPFGYSQVELPRSAQGTMAYVLKYLDKAKGERGEFSFSQRPAVGETYLLEFARRKARAGLALFPTGQPIYQVDGNRKDRGKSAGALYDYWLDPKSVIYERMIVAYVGEWVVSHPSRILPYDRLVHLWAERTSWANRDRVPASPTRQWLAVIWRCIEDGLTSGEALAFEPGPDEGYYFVTDAKRGVSQLWYQDVDTGEITWRADVATGAVGTEQAAERRKAAFLRGVGLPDNPQSGQEVPSRQSARWSLRAAIERQRKTRSIALSPPETPLSAEQRRRHLGATDRLERAVRKTDRHPPQRGS